MSGIQPGHSTILNVTTFQIAAGIYEDASFASQHRPNDHTVATCHCIHDYDKLKVTTLMEEDVVGSSER